jgi:outer membrane murein-binding lipoprotein Lpp
MIMMSKITKILVAVFISISTFTFSACNSGQQNKNDESSSEETISAKFMEMQNNLKSMVSEEFSAINDKVRELNALIEEKGEGLTDEQEKLLDEIQEKRVEVNNRLNEIDNTAEEDWEEFRASFEDDLEEIKTKLDSVLEDF